VAGERVLLLGGQHGLRVDVRGVADEVPVERHVQVAAVLADPVEGTMDSRVPNSPVLTPA
jgi:hypothetical protein